MNSSWSERFSALHRALTLCDCMNCVRGIWSVCAVRVSEWCAGLEIAEVKENARGRLHARG